MNDSKIGAGMPERQNWVVAQIEYLACAGLALGYALRVLPEALFGNKAEGTKGLLENFNEQLSRDWERYDNYMDARRESKEMFARIEARRKERKMANKSELDEILVDMGVREMGETRETRKIDTLKNGKNWACEIGI